MKRWIFAVPLIALTAFGGLGLVQLFDGQKPTFERVIREAPTAAFDQLGGGEPVSFTALAAERPIMVNLWASWCTPCLAEHPLLMELSRDYPGRLHGLVYDDSAANAAAFLERHGNPFTVIGMDPTGQGALEFGHTGVPETFVIAPDGNVTYHHGGQLTEDDLPALRAALDEASELALTD